MISKWTQHLTNPEDKKAFENELRGSKNVLNRLKTLMEEQETSLDYQELSLKAYDNPSWSHKQAHVNGIRQCIAFNKTLLNLDLQKETNDPRTKPIQASRPITT